MMVSGNELHMRSLIVSLPCVSPSSLQNLSVLSAILSVSVD